MPFQPFGYKFEVRSSQNVDAVKAAIRAHKKDWFEAKEGPRGWIVGPFLCLWTTALQRYGPMVLARISASDAGARIHGRAGSDLNGTLAASAYVAILAMIMVADTLDGQGSGESFISLFLVLLLPLVMWMAHNDRREADPLVRFLQRVSAVRSAATAVADSGSDAQPTAAFSVDGKVQDGPATAEDLRIAIEGLTHDGYVVLERAPQFYMQLLAQKDDYQLEKREGGASCHFQVHLSKGMSVNDATYAHSERTVISVMTDYLFGRPESIALNWKRLEL